MKQLKGTSAASGIAIGTVCLYSNETENSLPHYAVAPEHVEVEIGRVKSAFDFARAEMRRMIDLARNQNDQQAAEIFTTHLLILDDASLQDRVIGLVQDRRINAEHAVSDGFSHYIRIYEGKEGHFRELTHDFIDTRNRVLGGFNLKIGSFKCDIGASRPVIVAAKRLTPSMVLNIPKENVLAFVAEEGGFTAHATILARAYGVPIIFGISVEHELDCGMEAVVDGSRGLVITEPDGKTRGYYEKRILVSRKRKGICEVRQSDRARTRTGRRILLKINISTPEEFLQVRDFPHDGVGLLRTEFIFMRRTAAPSEDEQYAMYTRILAELPDAPVTIRLLDIGGDKMPPFLAPSAGVNPDLDVRGAMAVEAFPELYLAQVRALLRANEHGNLRLLFPMVADPGDLRTFKELVKRAHDGLRREKKFAGKGFPAQGIMVETPAAIMMLDELLPGVDFINIGSNDLLQYTLAVGRGNMQAQKRYHVMHPALVRMLEAAAHAGKRHKKEVCLCGEIAGFEEYYPVFLKAGLESFSVAVSRFIDIKCHLLHIRTPSRKKILTDFYRTRTREEAERYLSRFV